MSAGVGVWNLCDWPPTSAARSSLGNAKPITVSSRENATQTSCTTRQFNLPRTDASWDPRARCSDDARLRVAPHVNPTSRNSPGDELLAGRRGLLWASNGPNQEGDEKHDQHADADPDPQRCRLSKGCSQLSEPMPSPRAASGDLGSTVLNKRARIRSSKRLTAVPAMRPDVLVA